MRRRLSKEWKTWGRGGVLKFEICRRKIALPHLDRGLEWRELFLGPEQMMQIMHSFRVWVMQVMQWPIHAVLRDVLRSAVVRCSRAAWLWFASDLDSGPSGYCPLDSGRSKSDLVL